MKTSPFTTPTTSVLSVTRNLAFSSECLYHPSTLSWCFSRYSSLVMGLVILLARHGNGAQGSRGDAPPAAMADASACACSSSVARPASGIRPRSKTTRPSSTRAKRSDVR